MARQRPPTDEQKTSIYDSQSGKRTKGVTKKGFESGELAIPTPTTVDAVPRDKSEPIRVISMKAPADAEKQKVAGKQHKAARIRPLSEVRPQHNTPPRGMGYLAPPADARQARGRKLRDWLLWGSVLVIISCVVMLGVWFLAGR
jgi:hypothetical protein